MKKKIVILLLALIMVSSIFSGCGSTSSDTASSTADAVSTAEASSTVEATTADVKPVTLTLYGDSGDIQKPWMKKIFQMYEESTGNKLDVQGFDAQNFENVALTKFQTGDIPDLFMHHGGYSLDAYNPSKNFADFTNAEWVTDIEDSVIPTTKRNGVVYGLPFWEASVSGTFYNKVIFEKLGITVPKTQKEFSDACDKLLKNGVQPIYLAVKDVWPILYQFGMDPIFQDSALLAQLNSNKTTYSDIPAMKAEIQWFKDSKTKGYFGKTSNTDTWDSCMEVLGKGEAAMMFGWDTWLYSDYDSKAYTYKADDFGIMPAFMGTTDEGTFEGPNCELILANKNGTNIQQATDCINFMAKPENYNKAFEGIQTAPVFKGQTTIIATPQYTAAKDWIGQVGRASVANPEIIGFSSTDGAKCIQNLLAGGYTVDQCLKEMDTARIKIATSQQVEGFK